MSKNLTGKNILLLSLLLLLVPSLLSAQKTLRQKLAEEFCAEINKQNIPEKWDDNTMKQVGLAMLPVVGKYRDDIKKEFGLDLNNQDDYSKIGEIIGQEAALSCPKFKKIVEQMMDQKTSIVAEYNADGTFTGLGTSGSFAYLKVKGADGRELKIWWFEYFKGSDELVANPAAYQGKHVNVSYIEQEIYEPTMKDYIKVKVAKSLEVQ